MSQNNSSRVSKRMRVVVICRELEMRRNLMKGLLEEGDQAFDAESRADGMPLVYQIRPDLIFLQVDAGLEESWETFFRIRLFTDTPIVLLADQLPSPAYRSLGENNALLLIQPFTISKAIAKGKSFSKLTSGSTPRGSTFEDATNGTLDSQALKAFQVLAIDRALEEVGDRGEVRLIVSQGQLRYVAKLKTKLLAPESKAQDKAS